jgi:poly-gamma-glutamate system protein
MHENVLERFSLIRMLAVVIFLDPAPRSQSAHAKIAASRTMELAISALREGYLSRGLRFDDTVDPNHTSLIGVEYSEMVTTLGSADAKRSTTNPNVAGLVVQLLVEAEVGRGDTLFVLRVFRQWQPTFAA